MVSTDTFVSRVGNSAGIRRGGRNWVGCSEGISPRACLYALFQARAAVPVLEDSPVYIAAFNARVGFCNTA
jgi:hypothetical protein